MAVQGWDGAFCPARWWRSSPGRKLVALDIPGWPRAISTDLLWNKKRRRGSRKLAASASAAAGANSLAIADDLCDFTFLNNCENF
jgi:hypothetical protein